MSKRTFIAGLVCYLALSLTGCTRAYRQHNLTARPEQVRGWKEKVFDGVHSMAELVLDEGQSSEGSELGVEVVSISSYETRGGVFDHPTGPTAVLRFYRVSDHKVIQERAESSGGANLWESALSEYGIKGIYVNAINTKERWIWFDLRR